MRIIILENNKDKKGTALETLVKNILNGKGFNYVSTNQILAGGNEIDILAEKCFPSISRDMKYNVICECKAHEQPIDMTDWLKFLGKVYRERRKNTMSVGLMIALSDANGNVKGDIRDSNYGQEVQLLTGIDLMNSIISHYRMASIEKLQGVINVWSSNTILDRNILIFNNAPYWQIVFLDLTYTVLTKDGDFLEKDILNDILGDLNNLSTYDRPQYIDIRKDKVLRLKRTAIQTVALWKLMSGKMAASDIVKAVVEHTGDQIHPDEQEVNICLQQLDFITSNPDGAFSLKPVEEMDMIKFYRNLLNLGIPTPLYNSYYKDHIDESLLNSILIINSGLKLSEEEKEIVLFILKHSPSALRYALYPQKQLNPKINVDNANQEELNISLNSLFIQTLAHSLEIDSDSDISMFLFDYLELRDFYKQTIYHVVLKDGTEKTIPVSKRLYYIPFENGGGAVIQANKHFAGEYNKKTGFMTAYKNKNSSQQSLYGIVKHKSGVNEEYLALYQ